MVFEASGNGMDPPEQIESMSLEPMQAAKPTPEDVSAKNQLQEPLSDYTTSPLSSVVHESHFFLGGEPSRNIEPVDGPGRLIPFGGFNGYLGVLNLIKELDRNSGSDKTRAFREKTYPHDPWKTG
jgi:hypothetical protein